MEQPTFTPLDEKAQEKEDEESFKKLQQKDL